MLPRLLALVPLVAALLAGPAAALALSAPAGGGIEVSFLYNLSTLTGTVRLSGLGLSRDAFTKELFAYGYGGVRIYNPSGMEVFSFGDDEAFGIMRGVVAYENGDLLILTHSDGIPALVRCSYRGEPMGKLEPTGAPEGYRFGQDFTPSALAHSGGNLYLADTAGMRVLVTGATGAYVASYDVASLIEMEKKRADLGLNGFSVDRDGNLLVTVAPLFKAYVISPAGEVRSFGKSGSAPGLFNVVKGIASDEQGNLFVVDSLKCAVMVFDRDFRFLGEFGYRGVGPGRLIVPESIVVADGRVFVSQNGNRGVSVYQVRRV
jgi:hypothetical protein